MKRIKSISGYTIYQASARDVSKYNVEEGYFYLYFSSDIRDYGLSNCDWDWEAGSIEEAEEFANGTNYAIAKEIVEETTTAASFEEIQAVETKLDNGMTREEIEEESEEEPTLETRIANAISYASLVTMGDMTHDRWIENINNVANNFADTYEQYLAIYEALQKKFCENILFVYDFLMFFDEDDPGQHRFVVAKSAEDATKRLHEILALRTQNGYAYPEFICNPTLELEVMM